MNFGEFNNGKAMQALPPTLASHEANIEGFRYLCHELCIKLLRLIAMGLEVCDANHFLSVAPNESTD